MSLRKLKVLHAELDACTACDDVVGPVVHGAAIRTQVVLVGQAPGIHEEKYGRPFAWTAGKTLFRWFREITGHDEESVRARVFIAAVTRCFPGKAKGGGDLRPTAAQTEACRTFLSREIQILRPRLIIPVGTLAISEIIGHKGPLNDVIGEVRRVTVHGVRCDAIALPHPSGVSTWHKQEPGMTLLAEALRALKRHPAMKSAFASTPATAPGKSPTPYAAHARGG